MSSSPPSPTTGARACRWPMRWSPRRSTPRAPSGSLPPMQASTTPSSSSTATISLTPVDDPSAFGVVPTEDDGRVQAFIEKPPRHEAPTNLINAGTYVLEPDVLDRIPDGRRVSIERETFPALVAERSLYALG